MPRWQRLLIVGAAVLAVGSLVTLVTVDRYQQGGSRLLPWRDVTAQLGPVRWPRLIGRSFRDNDRLARFVAENDPARRTPVPAFDFAGRRLVLAAAGPRSSTGYEVGVVRVVEHRDDVVVLAGERTPSLGDDTEARLTFPYRLISIPETGKRIIVEWQGRP